MDIITLNYLGSSSPLGLFHRCRHHARLHERNPIHRGYLPDWVGVSIVGQHFYSQCYCSRSTIGGAEYVPDFGYCVGYKCVRLCVCSVDPGTLFVLQVRSSIASTVEVRSDQEVIQKSL